MKNVRTMSVMTALLVAFLVIGSPALARTAGSFDLPEGTTLNGTEFADAETTLEWNKTASGAIEVQFFQRGKLVASATGKLVDTGKFSREDRLVLRPAGDTKEIVEIRLARTDKAIVLGG